MFDIGFSELLLIAVAGIVVIGPKDLPVVVRHVAKCMRELRGAYAGIKNQMTQLADEAGLTDMKREMTTIIDLEGKPQVAYDVRELEGLRGVVPPPSGGGLGGGLMETQTLNQPPPQASPEGGGSNP